MLSEIKCAFPKSNLSAKIEKYVSVITSLMTEFSQRFQDISVTEKEIRLFSTPFLTEAEEVEKSLQLELTEMQCDTSLKSQHQLLSLPDFYWSLEKATFPWLRRHAKRMIRLFGSTYMCEQTFSLITGQKQIMNQNVQQSFLWCPSHLNHQTYTWPASHPSVHSAASLFLLSATLFSL